MALTKTDLKNIGKLANIPLSDKNLEKLEGQLSETLKFVEKLDEVDTNGKEATHSVTGLYNIERPDETVPSLSQKEALQNAKSKDDGFFKVKAIFEES